MIPTYGLTHIAVRVSDLEKSLVFYSKVFGARVMYRQEDFIQLQTPGASDIIVLQRSDDFLPNDRGIIHFGFRLKDPSGLKQLAEDVASGGGKIKEQGEFVPGEPYAFILDPDGYEIEVWYEKIPDELKSFN